MKPNAVASRIRQDFGHFGLARTAYWLFMKVVNLFFYFSIIRVFKKEAVDPKFVESNGGFQWQFLNESQLSEMARSAVNELSESFVQTALKKGDECFGCFDGQALACYAWYSNKPTDHMGLTFQFRPDYVYVYASFTYPKYRGRRLSASRGARALCEYLGRGYKGVVFFIDSHNFRSLRATYATLGNQQIGYIVVLKLGRHAWIHNSRGCREHGIYLANPRTTPSIPRPETSPRATAT